MNDEQNVPSSSVQKNGLPSNAGNLASLYLPLPLTALTGTMKFGWFMVGVLAGLAGVIISWLSNIDRLPRVRNEALKFAAAGFVFRCVLIILLVLPFLLNIGI